MICMDGFRSLENGERVKFDIKKRNHGYEAINVRSEDEEVPLRGSTIHPRSKNKTKMIRY